MTNLRNFNVIFMNIFFHFLTSLFINFYLNLYLIKLKSKFQNELCDNCF